MDKPEYCLRAVILDALPNTTVLSGIFHDFRNRYLSNTETTISGIEFHIQDSLPIENYGDTISAIIGSFSAEVSEKLRK